MNHIGIYLARHGFLASLDLSGIRNGRDYVAAGNALFAAAEERHTEGTGFV